VDAEPHFQRAARAFKSAGLLDSAVEAWRKAADCSIKMGNLKQAAVTLESAGRELAVLKEESSKVGACKLWAEAGGLLQEAGEAVRAADLKLRAAKLVEAFDPDLALRLTDETCNIFDGDTDKDVYAVEPLRKVMQMQLALGKHASAMRTMDRLFGVWTRLNQKHNLFKLVLSRVVLLLAAADPVSAQREYEKNFNLDGFVSTDEAAGAEDLLSAYSEWPPWLLYLCARVRLRHPPHCS
jgi:tetratricopeptide (TPR) repeat protein